ncbi:UDP-3-O-(3-hydroxymyristoyl) N-acetylglucosamine deacetylase [uncultured delta proteobacterium]|uniref:UDP-3-O-acyl-N-acetylglucosamine deacetylase n=1 Tax=uncultured delta proteobacterium TaxID=34034 RepID=A0A212JH49_9DELT|nr:UDP-3-O-(3-hydroxymyristoyl) N-acetylglucosamine deacetylase [uncultured delta proteobacterium]
MTQTTISQSIECTGIGLHSGKTVRLGLRPAAENTGIVFHVKTPHGIRDISPRPDIVTDTGLATTLGTGDARVATVEHLLATIRGLGIDNIHVDAEGGEIPIMDGSAAPFVMLLGKAGIVRQSAPRKVLRIKKPVAFSRDGKSIEAFPHDGFAVEYTINFPHQLIGVQKMRLELTPRTFSQISRARTFGFLREVEYLHSKGLALGGSLDNAIVLDDCSILNKEGLRFEDEFVRHKVLDFIGDMAMLDRPLQGRFVVSCSGHALNNEFLRTITANAQTYLEAVTLSDPVRGRETRAAHPIPAVGGGAPVRQPVPSVA